MFVRLRSTARTLRPKTRRKHDLHLASSCSCQKYFHVGALELEYLEFALCLSDQVVICLKFGIQKSRCILQRGESVFLERCLD